MVNSLKDVPNCNLIFILFWLANYKYMYELKNEELKDYEDTWKLVINDYHSTKIDPKSHVARMERSTVRRTKSKIQNSGKNSMQSI